jgi:hypothetical protein
MPAIGRTTLQIIAALTMLCDHIACVWVNEEKQAFLYAALRLIGRISFPIFCFLLVQGFLSTRDCRKYGLRLFIFAVLSELPYDLAFSGVLFDWSQQNVLVTLFVGLLVLCGIRRYETNPVAEGGVLLAGCMAAFVLQSDYSYFGIVLIALFYLLRENELSCLFWTALLIFIQGGREVYAVLALPFCFCYQGQKQERRLPRYFFYVFYPLHLLLLWSIYRIITVL